MSRLLLLVPLLILVGCHSASTADDTTTPVAKVTPAKERPNVANAPVSDAQKQAATQEAQNGAASMAAMRAANSGGSPR